MGPGVLYAVRMNAALSKLPLELQLSMLYKCHQYCVQIPDSRINLSKLGSLPRSQVQTQTVPAAEQKKTSLVAVLCPDWHQERCHLVPKRVLGWANTSG